VQDQRDSLAERRCDEVDCRGEEERGIQGFYRDGDSLKKDVSLL
jgi:hypothetical protein